MKLHKNDPSNKSSVLLGNFVIQGYLPLPWGYIHVLNREKKIYVKLRVRSSSCETSPNDQ